MPSLVIGIDSPSVAAKRCAAPSPSWQAFSGKATASARIGDKQLSTESYSREQRRTSNEGRREIFGLTHRQIAFVCECERPSCYETVPLTAREYDDRRLHGTPVTTVEHAGGKAIA